MIIDNDLCCLHLFQELFALVCVELERVSGLTLEKRERDLALRNKKSIVVGRDYISCPAI